MVSSRALITVGFPPRTSFCSRKPQRIVAFCAARSTTCPSFRGDVSTIFNRRTSNGCNGFFVRPVAGHLSRGENGLMKLKSADRKTNVI